MYIYYKIKFLIKNIYIFFLKTSLSLGRLLAGEARQQLLNIYIIYLYIIYMLKTRLAGEAKLLA